MSNFNKNILLINTYNNYSSIGLYIKHNLFKKKILFNNTSEYIINTIDKLFKLSNSCLKNIDFISCIIGPGKFTGLRLGVNISQSISFCLNIPIIKISSLQAISIYENKNKYNNFISVIKANSNYIYWTSYKLNKNNKIFFFIKENMSEYYSLENYINNLKNGVWIYSGYISDNININNNNISIILNKQNFINMKNLLKLTICNINLKKNIIYDQNIKINYINKII